MQTATILKSGLKIVVLTLALMILNIVGTMVTGLAATASSQGSGSRLLAMLVVSTIETCLLSYFVVRSRLAGWRLMVATALIYYGIKTFTAQLETAYFVSSVPRSMLPALFLMTVPAALVLPPLACLLFGRLRQPNLPAAPDFPNLPPAEWIWKALLVGAVIYPVLFFAAGYYIAWRNPDVRAFYGGVDNPNVLAYFANMFAKDPLVYPFEIMRGVLWFLLALPVVRTLRVGPLAKALLVALLFALVENAQHLIPNPLMPDAVRLTHFIETSSSNFVLGLVTTGLMFWRPWARRGEVRGAAAGRVQVAQM